MRVAKLVDFGKIEVVEQNDGYQLQGDEVLVRVKSAGICGTDLHIYQGHRHDLSLPRIMGHELVGEISGIGPDTKNFNIGDRVAIDPVVSCQSCYACRNNRNNICSDVKCLGVQIDGGFCDFIKVSENSLYRVPDHLSWEEAALIEPFAVAAQVLERSNIQKGEKAVIIGAGVIGLCILKVFKLVGADVLILDVEETRLKKAEELGANIAVNSNKENLQLLIQQFSNNEGANVVVEAVGNSRLLEEAITYTASGARVVVLGFDQGAAKIPEDVVTKKELEIKGSRMNYKKFPQVIQWFAKKDIDPKCMISKVYSLEDIDLAFKNIIESPEKFLKVVIKF